MAAAAAGRTDLFPRLRGLVGARDARGRAALFYAAVGGCAEACGRLAPFEAGVWGNSGGGAAVSALSAFLEVSVR